MVAIALGNVSGHGVSITIVVGCRGTEQVDVERSAASSKKSFNVGGVDDAVVDGKNAISYTYWYIASDGSDNHVAFTIDGYRHGNSATRPSLKSLRVSDVR